jgi:hypothetical protein
MRQVLSLEEADQLHTTAKERLEKGDKITSIITQFAGQTDKDIKSVSNSWYTNKKFEDLRKQFGRTYKPRIVADENQESGNKQKSDTPKKSKKDTKGPSQHKKERAGIWLPEEDEVLISTVDELRESGIGVDKACEQAFILFDRIPRTAKACISRYGKLKTMQNAEKLVVSSQDEVAAGSTQPHLRLLGKLPKDGEEVLAQLTDGINGLKNRVKELEKELSTFRNNYENLSRDHQLVVSDHDQLKKDHDDLARIFRGIKKLMQEAFGEEIIPSHNTFIRDEGNSLTTFNK